MAADAALEILAFLARLRVRLKSNRELDGLVSALRGDYLPPGPGGDLLQNPAILPTGRNTHAINPYAIPSSMALRRAEPLTRALLERHQRESGRMPQSIAMVLWGIDNIKKEGEAVAQVLWLLGVRPVRDGLNRVTEVEAIPLEQLGRPRIDVVMTVSGIFRDLFACTMELLDRAVKRVAALEEPLERNFVRKHVRQQMAAGPCTFEEAATRVFSNAAGNYGTNVNFMVLQSQWEDARELGDLFVKRKCFAYGARLPGPAHGRGRGPGPAGQRSLPGGSQLPEHRQHRGGHFRRGSLLRVPRGGDQGRGGTDRGSGLESICPIRSPPAPGFAPWRKRCNWRAAPRS